MAGMMEQARELGNTLARTEEYKALRRAIKDADDDREIAEARSALERLEGSIAASLRAGKEPPKQEAEEYESTVGRLQGNPTYQRLVAAQANFEKIIKKVNATIEQGMEEGAESRIILAP
ncbi:MAG: YlbF family regulator [Gemmatimonadota bacterium]|jgi:cell fate (sporulation/competence/biofilm development) regulator YlbF (YheA/YmcA/DUF963 family)